MADQGPVPGVLLAEVRVPARSDQLRVVRRIVRDALQGSAGIEEIIADVVLAVDEACQNVVRHAYSGLPPGDMVVQLFQADRKVVVRLMDFAPPVDVSRICPRDLGDLRPGGLGTYFIRAVMDTVEFRPPPPGAGNLLEMTKRIR